MSNVPFAVALQLPDIIDPPDIVELQHTCARDIRSGKLIAFALLVAKYGVRDIHASSMTVFGLLVVVNRGAITGAPRVQRSGLNRAPASWKLLEISRFPESPPIDRRKPPNTPRRAPENPQ